MIRPTKPASFYVTGGAVSPDARCYVERDADEQLYRFVNEGKFCSVLTTRQMGKTSLMARTMRRLHDENGNDVRTANIDLSAVLDDVEDAGAASDWYFHFAAAVADELGLDTDIGQWWSERSQLSKTMRLTRFFREVVLVEIAGPTRVVIFIDEVDKSIGQVGADGFFAAIRSCYNARATNPEFHRLTFVVLGVARPQDLIKDEDRTPFNIGEDIDIGDFTPDQAKTLLAGLPVAEPAAEDYLAEILKWTGGHPYLTQQLCLAVSAEHGGDEAPADLVQRLVTEMFLQEGRRRSDKNLSFVAARLLRGDRRTRDILKTYRRLFQGAKVVDDPQSVVQNELKLAGVAKTRHGDTLHVRNRIYREVFDQPWIRKNMPPVPVAYRVAVAAIVLLLLSPVFWYEVFYPRPFIAQLQKAEALSGDDFDLARENYETLRGVPFYRKRADQLWGELNARRLASAIELDRVTMPSSFPERQQAALKIAKSACDELNMSPLPAWQEHGKGGLARFHAQRLKEALNLDELAYEAAMKVESGEPVQELTVRQHQHAYQYALHAYDSLAAESSAWEVEAAADLALFFARRADREEYAEHFGPAVLWRLRQLVIDDQLGTRQALASLLGTNHQGLIRTWGKQAPLTLTQGVQRSLSSNGQFETMVYATPLDNDIIRRAMLHQDDTRLLLVSANGTIQSWSLQDAHASEPAESFVHKGGIANVVLSPDERRILSWNRDGTVCVWEFGQRECVRELRHELPELGPDKDNELIGVEYSHDGNRILTWSRTDTKLWGISKLEPIQEFDREQAISGAKFSRDGDRVVTWSQSGIVKLWDVEQNEPLKTFKHDNAVNGVFFSGDERRVLTWSKDETVRLWDVTQDEPLQTFEHHEPVSGALFSHDERLLLTWTEHRPVSFPAPAVRLWNVARGEMLRYFDHDGSITGARFSHDEASVLTWSEDGTVRLWDIVSEQTPPCQIFQHSTPVTGALLNRDSTRILSWSKDTVRLWDIAQGRLLKTFKHDNWVHDALFSGDETHVLTWSEHGTAKLWDVVVDVPLETSKQSEVVGVCFSRDGTLVLTWSDDGSAQLRDVTHDRLLQAFKHESIVRDAFFSKDSSRILTWTEGGTARLWDVGDNNPLRTYNIPDFKITKAIFYDGTSHVLTMSSDRKVRLWDVAEDRQLRDFPFDSDENVRIFFEQGRVIAWSFRTAKVWNVAEDKIRTFDIPEPDVMYGAMLSNDASRLLAWTAPFLEFRGGKTFIWNSDQEEPFQVLKNSDLIVGAVFSDDAKRVLTRSMDGTAQLWDVDNNALLGTYKHGHAVLGASFSPNETRVLTRDANAARLWDVNQGRLLQTFKHDSFHVGSQLMGARFNEDGTRVLTWTSNWLHLAEVFHARLSAGNQETKRGRLWSRRLAGSILDGPQWPTSEDRILIAQAWPSPSSVTVTPVWLDGDGPSDTPGIEGDPAKLLEEWQDRLGLKSNDVGNIVPLRPLSATQPATNKSRETALPEPPVVPKAPLKVDRGTPMRLSQPAGVQ